MPASFSDDERDRIRRTLISAARQRFARYGYRRTSIAELARDAGIAKGSVYLFFASKADVFLAVALEVEAEVRTALLEELARGFATPQERIAHFLRFQFAILRDHPLLALLTDPEEARSLMRDLPPGAMEELSASDDAFFAGIVEEWHSRGQIGAVDPNMMGALSRAIYAMSLQRDLIGAAVFDDVVDLLVDSLSRHLVGGPGATP